MPDEQKRSWLRRAFTVSDEDKARARADRAEWEARQTADAQQRWLAEEARIAQLTRDWRLPVLLRTYESGAKGETAFAGEAEILARHDYHPLSQSSEGSHLHAGRLLLTGGLSIFAGRSGIRSKGKLTVTFERRAPASAAEDRVACDRCGESIPAIAAVCRFCGAGRRRSPVDDRLHDRR